MYVETPSMLGTKRVRTIGSFVLVVACMLGGRGVVEARDADGERLGADLHELGTTRSDTLAPPDDASDWCYFKLESERSIAISLDVTSADASVELTLVDGTGDAIGSRNVGEGETTMRETLTTGLYYVEVSAESDVSYRLGIE